MSAFRNVWFPVDFFTRKPYLRMRRKWPQTADYFLRLVCLAREALDNGRIAAGGAPLDPEDLLLLWNEDPDHQDWFDQAVQHGLLDRDHDGCLRIPSWDSWWIGETDKSKRPLNHLYNTENWAEFCRLWQQTWSEPVPTKDLVELAELAGLRKITEAEPSKQANVLGRILGEVEGKDDLPFRFAKHYRPKTKDYLWSISSNVLRTDKAIKTGEQTGEHGCQRVTAGDSGCQRVSTTMTMTETMTMTDTDTVTVTVTDPTTLTDPMTLTIPPKSPHGSAEDARGAQGMVISLDLLRLEGLGAKEEATRIASGLGEPLKQQTKAKIKQVLESEHGLEAIREAFRQIESAIARDLALDPAHRKIRSRQDLLLSKAAEVLQARSAHERSGNFDDDL